MLAHAHAITPPPVAHAALLLSATAVRAGVPLPFVSRAGMMVTRSVLRPDRPRALREAILGAPPAPRRAPAEGQVVAGAQVATEDPVVTEVPVETVALVALVAVVAVD